jgi:hypothetical protein
MKTTMTVLFLLLAVTAFADGFEIKSEGNVTIGSTDLAFTNNRLFINDRGNIIWMTLPRS